MVMIRRRFAMIGAILALAGFSHSQAQNLLDAPECIAFDAAHDRYLVSSLGNGRIVQVEIDQVTQSVFHQFGISVLGNCVADGVFYVSHFLNPGAVAAFNLNTDSLLWTVTVLGSTQLDGMAADTSGNLYVLNMTPALMYRIRLSDQSYSIFLDTGLPGMPQDAVFDEVNNRLLVVGYATNSPVVAISLPDGTPSPLVPNSPGGFDGITRDNDGNIYASDYKYGAIYAWNSDGSNQHIATWGYTGGPSGIAYNRRDDILAIPISNADRVAFVNMSDHDNDDVPYFQDNCPQLYNPAQEDTDLDHIGDSCDLCTDTDYDGFGDPGFPANTCVQDNCPADANVSQLDFDSDGVGDTCDNCDSASNYDQMDSDQDGTGDACEGCCRVRVGDVNGEGEYPDEVTLGDIMLLVDVKFVSGDCSVLPCLTEADVNQDGGVAPTCDDHVTLGDIMMLVDYLFITGPGIATLNDCP
jgi:hypothetical protein